MTSNTKVLSDFELTKVVGGYNKAAYQAGELIRKAAEGVLVIGGLVALL